MTIREDGTIECECGHVFKDVGEDEKSRECPECDNIVCFHCGYSWEPRKEQPKKCPYCQRYVIDP